MLRASASSLRFTPVYSSPHPKDDLRTAPFSFFLEIDGVCILLDCGWDDTFQSSYLEQLLPFAQRADCVLLSSPDIAACGALPFVAKHLKHGAFISACSSTVKIGLHNVLNHFLYHYPSVGSFEIEGVAEAFALDVDAIYGAFRTIQEPYGGKTRVQSRHKEVECESLFAGRLFGSFNWLIKYQIDELFYCPDLTVKQSHCLQRMTFPNSSSVLFLQSFPFGATPVSAAKKKEEQAQDLFQRMLPTLRGGGDVLLPVNAACRGLDVLATVLHLISERSSESEKGKYKVVLAAFQAAEILSEAATMTEIMKHEVISSDHLLFADAIPCSSAEEVLRIRGPKIVLADGAALQFGLAAELLEHFLAPTRQGGENLVLLTDPLHPGTAASHFMSAYTQKQERVSFSFVHRRVLNKEELEKYYVEQERLLETEKQKVEAHGAFEVLQDDIAVDEDEAAETDQEPAANMMEDVAGLVIPSYLNFKPKSKFLLFPPLETSSTLSTTQSHHSAYGLPLSEEEKILLRHRMPTPQLAEGDALEDMTLHHDAQEEAKTPSEISTRKVTCNLRCKFMYLDLSGHVDGATLKTVLNAKLHFVKKVVAIRGGTDEGRQLSLVCRSSNSMKCGDHVFTAQSAGSTLELATRVFSYVVDVDPKLANTFANNVCKVRGTNQKDVWEVGWVNGQLRARGSDMPDEPESKRARTEASIDSFRLSAVSGPDVQRCAEFRNRNNLHKGSFFVGEMELSMLRDEAKKSGLHSEYHRKNPMLVFDEGVCVRKGATPQGGVVTISAVINPTMFEVRQNVYKQFDQIL
ncbi:cleavage and polyadenylation specificity factor subunit 2 [Strigomonas culicis]|uniref:Cleavage and polyadenylation specificity factor subunit 2 n=1 Tax=Strigomonas culicis TaxID=28005 RepID=S9U6I4_9TRYP|nr:cleavage and polyadenylation specificity factor subunit 2 [Strigomonas culicis]|eukprot:EPY24528.1 cleavage and polyadenylation specificity factor subunit 2 [Strigomonas culicis]